MDERQRSQSPTRKSHLTARATIATIALVLLLPFTAAGREEGSSAEIPGLETTIIVGGGDSFAPFHFMENGRPTGMDVELLEAVAKAVNLEVIWQLEPWRETRGKLRSGEIDVHAGLTFSAARAALYRFATPHLIQQHRIFCREGEGETLSERDLYGHRIIVQRGGVMEDYVRVCGYTETPILAQSALEALQLLAAGSGDCVLLAEFRGLYVMREHGIEGIVSFGDPIEPSPYGFAVGPGSHGLLPRLNSGLAILKQTGEFDRIYDRWFGVLKREHLTTGDYLRYAAWVVLPLLVCMLAALVWSWSLRRRVRERTAELLVARDAAQAASKTKSEFLAMMSHEIRTPLNGVIGMCELLDETNLDSDQREMVETISSSGGVLMSIITDILDFSKIEAGERRLEITNFDLRAKLEQAAALLQPQAESRGLPLLLELNDRLPGRVMGDSTALQQIILNLASNALKFTHKGRIVLQADYRESDADAGTLRMEVRDTGIGIEPKKREEIFNVFTQADNTMTRRYGGTGLGLAICKRLVDQMGGRIGCDSAEADGSVFWFEIPLARETAGATTATVDDCNLPPLRGRVLVAEDNALNRRVIEMMLQKLGLDVETAVDGEEAVRACSLSSFDCVLMDCQMPSTDGFAATRAIRSTEDSGRPIPVIALTAGAVSGDRDKCFAAGMNDYLTKPIEISLLRQALDRWLPSSRGGGDV